MSILQKIAEHKFYKATFANLAKFCTDRQPWFFGLLPTLATVATLFMVAGAITLGLMAWATSTTWLLSFVPTYLTTAASLCGITFLKVWFSRELTHVSLSARDITEDFVYNESNPTYPFLMVEQLRHELRNSSETLKNRYPTFEEMPRPRLSTCTTDLSAKTKAEEGRNPGRSGLYFSAGFFLPETGFQQRHQAALIQMDLHRLYFYRGVTGAVVRTIANLAATLKKYNKSPSIFKQFIGLLEWPVRFLSVFAFAVNRSYIYSAFAEVVANNRGVDLMEAIDRKVCPSQINSPSDEQLKKAKKDNAREPYQDSGLIKIIVDWIDENELATDDKSGYRIFSLGDIVVREGGLSLGELFSEAPRATRLKDYGRELLQVKRPDGTMATYATEEGREYLRKHYKERQKLAEQSIPENLRYTPICADGDGYTQPLETSALGKLEARLAKTEARIRVLEQENAALKQELLTEIAQQQALLHAQINTDFIALLAARFGSAPSSQVSTATSFAHTTAAPAANTSPPASGFVTPPARVSASLDTTSDTSPNSFSPPRFTPRHTAHLQNYKTPVTQKAQRDSILPSSVESSPITSRLLFD